ncbi:competence type IV pilus minor pilin ComGF [Staphylococcus kloosii]|uniref:competence type IV pilus minor pilin ComGF n=1 Tax=Staphylococcus kloosii TaxID=29384 RepID=UPI002B4BD5F7|nr:competence type IV pilus minor pilin ComGF [Staphylococcus kloosii]
MKKYVINKKVKAFTMIEMMLAMLIMLILVQLIPFLLKTILIFNTNITSIADIELEFFLRDMIKDYKETKKVTIVNNNNIKFQKGDTIYYYKFKNNKVIKEVNNSGNITMLYNVMTFNVTELNNDNFLIDIKLQDKGEIIEKTLYF